MSKDFIMTFLWNCGREPLLDLGVNGIRVIRPVYTTDHSYWKSDFKGKNSSSRQELEVGAGRGRLVELSSLHANKHMNSFVVLRARGL